MIFNFNKKRVDGRESGSKTNRGFSLFEMVIYIALLALIMTVIINMLVSVIRSQANIKASKAIEETFISSFERIVREIRDARSIDPASTFGSNIAVNVGSLKLNTNDSLGNLRVVEFYVEQGVVKLKEDDVVSGPLTPASASVTSLIFRSIDSGYSKAVRIEMIVQSGQGAALKTESLSTTAILRGTY